MEEKSGVKTSSEGEIRTLAQAAEYLNASLSRRRPRTIGAADERPAAAIVLQSRIERDTFEHVQVAPIAQVYDLGRSELIASIGEIVDICIFHYDLGFHFPAAIVLVDVVVRSAARSA